MVQLINYSLIMALHVATSADLDTRNSFFTRKQLLL